MGAKCWTIPRPSYHCARGLMTFTRSQLHIKSTLLRSSALTGPIVMAPNFLSKIFKRKKPEPKFTLREYSPNAIGISDSTCEINGDIHNRWKLPIQPEQCLHKLGDRKCSSQQQSPFFRLPAEIRRLIYLELVGGRRVHIRYFWREPWPPRPQSKRSGPHWHWCHGVCIKSDGFPEDTEFDNCSMWLGIPGSEGTMISPRIAGVEWLRCCQIG